MVVNNGDFKYARPMISLLRWLARLPLVVFAGCQHSAAPADVD